MKPKVFCIGLHKTGTTSLHDMAANSGFKAVHGTTWDRDKKQLRKYNFFCDGGSHYTGQHELDYKSLEDKYPDALFIINIREIGSWIRSKLKHARWDRDPIVSDSKSGIYKHKEWRVKSKLNIRLFIDHYLERYKDVIEYFMDKPHKAIIVDLVGNMNTDVLHVFLGLSGPMDMSHKNKTKSRKLPNEVHAYIDSHLKTKADQIQELDRLVEEFNRVSRDR